MRHEGIDKSLPRGPEWGALSTQRKEKPVLPNRLGQASQVATVEGRQDSTGWRRNIPHWGESMSQGPGWGTRTAVGQCGSGDTEVISCGGARTF